MEDFYLEDESQMESDHTGPRLLIDEIHAAINETKYGTSASRLLMIFLKVFLVLF